MGNTYAVIVVIDAMRADAVGAYGNARAETPFLDRLAAESTLFDFAFSLDPTIESFYRAALAGIHPWYAYAGIQNAAAIAPYRPLCELARQCCFTDDRAVAEMELGASAWSATRLFSAEEVGPSSQDSRTFQRFFHAAAAWLHDCFASPKDAPTTPTIGWVHTSLLTLQEYGADSALARQLYDSQVSTLDAGIGQFFTQLSFPDEASEVLFVVTGARGYGLDERGARGVVPPLLHEELLHVPLVVYSSAGVGASLRVPRLVSPLGIHALLSARLGGLEAIDGNEIPAWDSLADCLFFANSQGDRGIRTPGWYLLRTADSPQPLQWHDPSPARHLYLKPDDSKEFNEISARRPEIVQLLEERLEIFGQQVAAGQPPSAPPLPAALLKGS